MLRCPQIQGVCNNYLTKAAAWRMTGGDCSAVFRPSAACPIPAFDRPTRYLPSSQSLLAFPTRLHRKAPPRNQMIPSSSNITLPAIPTHPATSTKPSRNPSTPATHARALKRALGHARPLTAPDRAHRAGTSPMLLATATPPVTALSGPAPERLCRDAGPTPAPVSTVHLASRVQV